MNCLDLSGRPLRLLVMTISALALFGCSQPSFQEAPSLQTKAVLPEISTFLTKPSDRFLVDIKEVASPCLTGAEGPTGVRPDFSASQTSISQNT